MLKVLLAIVAFAALPSSDASCVPYIDERVKLNKGGTLSSSCGSIDTGMSGSASQYSVAIIVESVNNDKYHLSYRICQGNNGGSDSGCRINAWKTTTGNHFEGNFRETESTCL
jgi:hypothetical protein